MNELEKLFGKTNLQTSQTTATTEEETALAEIREHIEKLKETEEVKKLAETINIDDSESILNFANDVSEKISQVSKDIIAVTGSSNSEEITNMMDTLGRIVKRFSLKDLTYKKPPQGFVAKLMYTVAKKTKATFSQVMEKFNNLSSEVDTILLQLQKYKGDIKTSDINLKKLYNAHKEHIETIEKHIAALSLKLDIMEEFIPKIKENKEISPDDKMLMLTRIEKTKNQLNEKEHQLRVKKGVSLQDCAIIDRIAENNYFLLNNINMASEVLVPTLRQNVILGQEAQRQDIQNTVINNISKVTNDIVEQNSKYTGELSYKIRESSSTAMIQTDVLTKSYENVISSIERNKQLEMELKKKREEDIKELERLEIRIKKAQMSNELLNAKTEIEKQVN
jgi:toxic anion resistance family protein